MNRRRFLSTTASLAGASIARSASSTTRPTSARAATSATTRVHQNVVWHDVRGWGVEGRGFDDTENYFDRLPARAKGIVRDAVWSFSRHTSGMAALFEADASEFYVRYALLNEPLAMAHMPATGVSGVDLYGKTERGWHRLATHSPKSRQIEARLIAQLAPGRRAYRLNLPLYNGVTSLEIGLPSAATFVPVAPRKDKPILFYGTSITQGGCASRPGMSYTNILGRRLNRPMLNFGFSGNGKTEVEVARFLAELDPVLFVLDTSANTPPEQLRERTEAVVKVLRDRHPATPVLLLERDAAPPLVPHLANQRRSQVEALREAHANLRAAGDLNVHHRGADDLLGDDHEATVDGVHPTDLGMMRYADALEPDLRRLIAAA